MLRIPERKKVRNKNRNQPSLPELMVLAMPHLHASRFKRNYSNYFQLDPTAFPPDFSVLRQNNFFASEAKRSNG
jgi:hypothetical protein